MLISSSDEETLRSDSAQGQRGVGSRHAYMMLAEGELLQSFWVLELSIFSFCILFSHSLPSGSVQKT